MLKPKFWLYFLGIITSTCSYSSIEEYYPYKVLPGASNYGNTGLMEIPNARFMPETGQIIFVRDSSLWGAPFDINELKIIGDENLLVQNIETNGILGSAAYSFSRNGRLIYLSL